jgi:hypothetical protein
MRKERRVRKNPMSQYAGSRQEVLEDTTRDGDLVDQWLDYRRATGQPALPFLEVR